MSSKSFAKSSRATSKSKSTRSPGAVERLEDRRLLSATIGLVNPDILPGSSRLIFNTIQNPDTTTPNGVHNTQALQIVDTGTDPLVISSMAISGPWTFVNAPAGGYTNVTVNPGTPLTVTLQFTQNTLPAHSTNETNYTANPNGGAYIDGSLSIASNDSVNPTTTVTLAGYWQGQSADEEEPNISTIVNSLAGYDTVIATPSQLSTESNGVDLQNNGATPTYYGQEVAATSWQAADTTQAVTIQQLAQFYIEGQTSTTYWYSAATQSSNALMTAAANQGQTLLPTTTSGGLMEASFTPGGAFGLRFNNSYSSDAINTANGDTTDDGHRFRFYPLIDSNGNAVANTWIVAVHVGTALADYQDAVYVVSNMTPAAASTTPPAPTNLTASSAVDPALNWTGVTYTNLAGYNVYRGTSATGTFTKLTSTPITTTTFTDSSAPAGDTLYYRVTAVDSSSGNESAPATTTANTPGGPVAGSTTVSEFSGASVDINVLTLVTDATGTVTPGSLTVSTPSNGTATANTTSGVITYTSNAGYTGTDTFVYSISDSNGGGPSTGTITVNVENAATVAPTVSPQSGVTLANTPVTLTPVALNSSGGTITPQLVEIGTSGSTFTGTTLPATITTAGGGTAVLNSNFTVTYTPKTNFVGADSFLFKIEDSNGNFSAQQTYSINVGVQISSAKGANKTLVYPDKGGQAVTVTLNRGVANVYYAGSGLESAAKGKITVTGSGLFVSGITATQTSSASTLALTTKRNAGTITLGGVTDTGTIGSVVARSANLAGVTGTPTISLGGVKAIYLESAASSDIVLGSAGVTGDSLTVGAVTNSFFTSTAPVNALSVKSWGNTTANITAEIVTAPIIKSLVVAGEFDPDLELTGTGKDLNSARVSGAVNKGLWTIAGSAGPITIGSVASGWGGIKAAGTLSGLTIKTGGMSADISAGTITSLRVPGTLSGDITTTGNLLSLTAGQLVDAVVAVGSTAANVSAVTTQNLGNGTLKSLHLTSKSADTFSDSSVIAGTIGSIVTGPINDTGTPEGIAALSVKSASLTVDGTVLNFSAKTLISDAAITTFAASKGKSLGSFVFDIV